MPNRPASELLHELNSVDESARIEAKRGREIGRSFMETVSAFANEPGLNGGYLLLGVMRSTDRLFGTQYEVVGVANPDQVQSDLASGCASQMNAVVRPQIAVEAIDGKPVIVAYIPESPTADKPVYITSRGLPKGPSVE